MSTDKDTFWITAVAVTTVAAISWAVWYDCSRPTFTLKKDEWFCTKEEAQTHQQTMIVGKAIILQPVSSLECIEYKRQIK